MSNAERVTTAVTNIILRSDPNASINDLCRACLDAGLPVSKQLVASVRRTVRAAVDRVEHIPTLEDAQGMLDEIKAKAPTAAVVALATHRDPDELAREQEEKRVKQAEREAKWAVRRAEQEAEWAKERAAEEAAQEASPTPAPIQLDREAPSFPPESLMDAGGLVADDEYRAPAFASIRVTQPDPESRRHTTAGRMLRRQRLNEILDADPGIDPVVLLGRVKDEFGVGLDWRYVYATCRVAREVHSLPQIPEYGPHVNPRTGGAGVPMPTFSPTAGDSDVDAEYAETPEEEFAWLARQANDIMRAHGLTELSLVVENGRAKWKYQVVKRAEGEINL